MQFNAHNFLISSLSHISLFHTHTLTLSHTTLTQVKVLYIRNLMLTTTEAQIEEVFSKFAPVERVKKIRDYAFVHFHSKEDAHCAMEAMNGRGGREGERRGREGVEGGERREGGVGKRRHLLGRRDTLLLLKRAKFCIIYKFLNGCPGFRITLPSYILIEATVINFVTWHCRHQSGWGSDRGHTG